MAVNHVFLADIQSGLRSEEVVFRLIYLWEARRPTKGNNLMGLEMLLIDEQGTTIQGFIAPNQMARFQPLLKRNSIYRLNNFYATQNKTMFRVSDHELTLCFTNLTTILQLDEAAYSIEAQIFKIHSFSEFKVAADRKGDLYDAIGHIKLINIQHLHEHPTLDQPNGQKDRVNVHLQLKDGPVVNVYLWDNAASEFLSKFHTSQTIPKVLLVKTVNPKRLGDSVSLGTMSPSRVFLDSEVGPTHEYLTWLGDNASTLAVVNTSQVTKLETFTIADLLEFLRVQPSQQASFAKLQFLMSSARLVGITSPAPAAAENVFVPLHPSCDCAKENAVGILKYRVELLVHDNSGTAVFVFLDDVATPLAGRSATTLMDNLSNNGGISSGGEVPFPECLCNSIGRTFKLEVKLTDYSFRATRKTITVSKIMESEVVTIPAPLAANAENSGTNTSAGQLVETNASTSTNDEAGALQSPKNKKAALNEIRLSETDGEFTGETTCPNPKRPRRTV